MSTHSHTQTSNETFLESLRKNWMLIVFVGGIIIQWSNTNYRLNSLETSMSNLSAVVQKNTTDISKVSNDFNVAIVEIKANYIFIKEKLEKLDK